MHTSLSEKTNGRWPDILSALGIDAKALNGKHGPCPICGGGTDRFRFDNKEGRGTWICNHCGAGDGIALVMKMRNVDFKSAAALVEPLIGAASVHKPKSEPSDADKRRWLNDLWNGGVPITAQDPAGMYLNKRVGLERFPTCLRYHDSAIYTGTDGKRSRGPAMLAKVTDHDGLPINVHRTFLTHRGDKAPIPKPRAIMPGHVPQGSAVRLAPAGDVLGVAEGIETALAVSRLHKMPCWACLNAMMLSKWSPPPGVKKVIIFADNDANYVGQHAAFQLANRLIVRDRFEAEVRTPPTVGTDWNDVLLAQAGAALPINQQTGQGVSL